MNIQAQINQIIANAGRLEASIKSKEEEEEKPEEIKEAKTNLETKPIAENEPEGPKILEANEEKIDYARYDSSMADKASQRLQSSVATAKKQQQTLAERYALLYHKRNKGMYGKE